MSPGPKPKSKSALRLDALWKMSRRRRFEPPSCADLAKELCKEAGQQSGAVEELRAFFETEAPSLFAGISSIDYRAGYVNITADAATSYALSALLRGGLERRAMRQSKFAIKRIKVAAR